MKTEPLVSIVMNCFNGERFLKEAIDSIYCQTYSNWEIIFWDNNSTDKSSSIANSYTNKLKYFSTNKKISLGEARSSALKKTTGEYIAFLDCDDLFEVEKIEKQVSLMESDDFIFCYGSAMIINDKGSLIGRSKVNNNGGNIFGDLLLKYDINMQSVMIRKNALNQKNFNTELKFSPDYNLFMELASKNRVGVITDYIVRYRKTNNSLTLNSASKIYHEKKYTLDYLISNEKLYRSYTVEFDFAYKMLNFSKAIYHIAEDDYVKARLSFKKIVKIKFKYRVFYYLLHLPIRKKTLLRKLLGY